MGVGDLAWMTADWFFCPQLRKLSEATTRGHSMLVLVQRDNIQIVHLKGCKHFCLCDDVIWLEVTTCMTLRPGAVVVLRISGCVRVWVRAGIVIFFPGEPRECFPAVPVCAMVIQTDANSSALCQRPVGGARGDTDSGLVLCLRVPFSFYFLNREIFQLWVSHMTPLPLQLFCYY